LNRHSEGYWSPICTSYGYMFISVGWAGSLLCLLHHRSSRPFKFSCQSIAERCVHPLMVLPGRDRTLGAPTRREMALPVGGGSGAEWGGNVPPSLVEPVDCCSLPFVLVGLLDGDEFGACSSHFNTL
jgi:hypothetical protein